MGKVTTATFKDMKARGEKITMLTAYDYSSAKLYDEAGIDVLLVGDSLGMVVLGYDSTLPVTMDDMIHHVKAVSRGTKNAMVVADLPFLSYHISVGESVRNAGRFLQEAGAHCVKLEGGREVIEQVKSIVAAGIPVMGHLGLTPQAINQFGGFKTQGQDKKTAKKILDDALLLQEAGAFSVVLEKVPAQLARLISQRLDIPTIGIGAGADCDGQVLVSHDLLGIFTDFIPKFVKKYADLRPQIIEALQNYSHEVREGIFPGPEHGFTMDEENLPE